jgi:methylated-DNA-protein-cysteine methyltransferase related protein
MHARTSSYELIYAVVRRIPRGRVATYGQVASLAGLPRHARLVGYALHALPDRSDVPWHRVVNALGRTSPRSDGMGHDQLQRLMLRREGIRFSREGALSLARYRWHPRPGATPVAQRLRTAVAGLALAAILGGPGCSSMIDGFSGRGEACEILAIGTPASGTIVRLVDTHTTINDDPVVEFVVRVTAAGREPWEARTKGLVSRLDVPAIQPGRVVPVKYDPSNPQRIALDLWDCPKK